MQFFLAFLLALNLDNIYVGIEQSLRLWAGISREENTGLLGLYWFITMGGEARVVNALSSIF